MYENKWYKNKAHFTFMNSNKLLLFGFVVNLRITTEPTAKTS